MTQAVLEGSVTPAPPRCSFQGCDKPRRGEFCVGHANQKAKGKKLTPLRKVRFNWSEEDRFWDLVDVRDMNGCWEWQAKYATFSLEKMPDHARSKTVLAYRYSYSFFNPGEDIEGVTIHHTCANRLCVNPDHLQSLSIINNVAEMVERNSYLRQIKQLKKRVAELEALLEGKL